MILKKTIIICVLYSIILSCNDIESYYEPLPENIDFNFHVKPILVQNCYLCHGPDPSSRKANLRLDTNEGLMAILEGGGFAVVPGAFQHQSPIYLLHLKTKSTKYINQYLRDYSWVR